MIIDSRFSVNNKQLLYGFLQKAGLTKVIPTPIGKIRIFSVIE